MVKAGSAKAMVNQVECPVSIGTTYKINIVDIDRSFWQRERPAESAWSFAPWVLIPV